jgi:hypothetical protein
LRYGEPLRRLFIWGALSIGLLTWWLPSAPGIGWWWVPAWSVVFILAWCTHRFTGMIVRAGEFHILGVAGGRRVPIGEIRALVSGRWFETAVVADCLSGKRVPLPYLKNKHLPEVVSLTGLPDEVTLASQ